jgi:hypothetical protein
MQRPPIEVGRTKEACLADEHAAKSTRHTAGSGKTQCMATVESAGRELRGTFDLH